MWLYCNQIDNGAIKRRTCYLKIGLTNNESLEGMTDRMVSAHRNLTCRMIAISRLTDGMNMRRLSERSMLQYSIVLFYTKTKQQHLKMGTHHLTIAHATQAPPSLKEKKEWKTHLQLIFSPSS